MKYRISLFTIVIFFSVSQLSAASSKIRGQVWIRIGVNVQECVNGDFHRPNIRKILNIALFLSLGTVYQPIIFLIIYKYILLLIYFYIFFFNV